ncbi:Uncharacterised protein [Bordetella pertussis]|nr:Uncharacterised protein [Bordetella pertussis]
MFFHCVYWRHLCVSPLLNWWRAVANWSRQR